MYLRVRARACVCVCASVCLCACACVDVCACICVYVYVCVSECVYVRARVSTSLCVIFQQTRKMTRQVKTKDPATTTTTTKKEKREKKQTKGLTTVLLRFTGSFRNLSLWPSQDRAAIQSDLTPSFGHSVLFAVAGLPV